MDSQLTASGNAQREMHCLIFVKRDITNIPVDDVTPQAEAERALFTGTDQSDRGENITEHDDVAFQRENSYKWDNATQEASHGGIRIVPTIIL